ncbi:MAG: succinyl-CoA synthetase subunit alpha [Methanomassiliicoccales archaeon PtaU1.Bin124]|nr:MAG: succinyl-CoA synthetase subunit alpha [Methanomassiliicoccales archaeon PtaU1.Bin124]
MRELFEPNSVAVVGAAREPNKVGHVILKNLIEDGFQGPIYPVNPKAEEILGLKCYPSLTAVPGDVELVVIVTPAKFVNGVMEEAGKRGIKAAIVISAGFKEAGKEGAVLEAEMSAIAKLYGMRVLGPNCLGLISTHHKMNATFTATFPSEGGVAISSQSGAICSVLLDWAAGTNMGFSKFVSVGNKMDIEESYLLEYFRNDDETKVIGMYIEAIDRGKDFLEQAKLTTRTKPIIALKAGRTATGAKAASSHTGALSGSDRVYDAALQKVGIIRVKTMEELFDLLTVFSSMPLPKDDRVAIVTNAGGLGVMAADALADSGLTLASLRPETLEKLKNRLPPAANLYNPVDVIGDADADRYEAAIQIVMEDENVSSILALMAPTDLVDIPSVARTVGGFAGSSKPIVTAFVGGEGLKEAVSILRRSGVPNYESPDRAAHALGSMLRYKADMAPSTGPIEVFDGDKAMVRAILDKVRSEDRLQLTEGEGKGILSAYGIFVPGEGLARTEEEAVQLANSIGYPVVLKVESPDIAHKTDVGGVVVNMRTDEEVRLNFQLIRSRAAAKLPNARIDGVTVEKMFSGREVIVGMVRDEQFGPVMTVGLGGIFVEILKDVTQTIAPITRSDASRMIRSIKAYPILTGARGRRPADVKALEDVILRMAQIALDFPEISEFEINPVMVGDEGAGAGAVDALVTIRRERA